MIRNYEHRRMVCRRTPGRSDPVIRRGLSALLILAAPAMLAACGDNPTITTEARPGGPATGDSVITPTTPTGGSATGEVGSEPPITEPASSMVIEPADPSIGGGSSTDPGAAGDPGTSSSGNTGDPDDSVSSSPMLPPGDVTIPAETYENAGEVERDERAQNPRPVSLLRLEYVEGQIRMVWYGGVCDRIASIDVIESAEAVTVDLQVGSAPGVDVCVEMAVLSRAAVDFPGGLGGRSLVDANAG